MGRIEGLGQMIEAGIKARAEGSERILDKGDISMREVLSAILSAMETTRKGVTVTVTLSNNLAIDMWHKLCEVRKNDETAGETVRKLYDLWAETKR